MSKVKVNGQHGFVGLGGVPTELVEHEVYDAGHPLVKAFPHFFDEVPEAPKRPILSRKPKDEGVDA